MKQIKLEQNITRLLAEREGLSVAAASQRIAAAQAAAKQAQIDAVISPTLAAKTAAETAARELEQAIDAETATIERDRLLGEALASLDAQLPALARVAEEEEKEAIKKALSAKAEAAIATIRALLPTLWMSARCGGRGIISLADLGRNLDISEGAIANEAAALHAEIVKAL
ncbi:hypothetical protein [Anaeromyxobacter sp. SG66]|uniref:hypothetical protein n=1 Tax=Anaeromyxobacter sp. SG66 TaxID=2925410 RepID=UPI001F58D4D0|nr:hypothetical protein [Anaeromyxobacter sp. SG66]